MINLKLTFTLRKDLEYLNVFHGMVIVCKDTRECFYVNHNKFKVTITLNSVILRETKCLDTIISPILSRVYIIEETNRVFKYTTRWVEVTNEIELLDVVEDSLDFTPSLIMKDDKFYAPKTVDNAVYMSDGTKLSTAIENNMLTVTKSKAVYIEAEVYKQRVFNIPFPLTNYNLCKNHMSIVLRGQLLESNKYVINNDKLILNTGIDPIQQGELILFMFYYTIILDLNENVVLTTKNYEDFSITTEKLSQNIRLRASHVLETATRFFLTPEERQKLLDIDYGATRYIHPETHPAEMIIQSDERNFISRRKLEELDRKAFAKDVYTKIESNQLIQRVYDEILDSSPDTLNTLKELAEALGNDRNFSETIMRLLGEKANTGDITRLDTELEKKVNVNDYTKAGIYSNPNKYNTLTHDVYEVKLMDPMFKEYIDGMIVTIKITDSNTRPCLLRINSLEDKPLLTQDQHPLIANELKDGSIYTLRYNGNTGNFILQGKGGVTLVNSTQTEYFVDDNESITRGDIVDITNNKVKKSSPKFNLTSTHEGFNDKFNCTGDISITPLLDNTFIITWVEQNLLKMQLLNLDGNKDISDMYMDTPILVNIDCKYFKVIKKSNNKIVIIYCTSNNYITSMLFDIESNIITPGNTYIVDEIDDISNLIAVGSTGNKIIVGYQVLDKTKLYYLQIVDNEIVSVSNRTNSVYPLDYYKVVNDEQILFLGLSDNTIKGWVVNIYDNELNYTSLINISEDIDITNISLTLLQDNMVYMNYTNTTQDKLYEQYLEVDVNGNIQVQPKNNISSDIEEVKELLFTDRIRYNKEYYISMTNYDRSRTNTLDDNNRDYLKLTINDNSLVSKNGYTVINKQYTASDICLINTNVLLVSYIVNNKIHFNTFIIKNKPDGIAMSTTKAGQPIMISEW